MGQYGPTSRLGLVGPDGNDPAASGDDRIRALMDRLDLVAARDDQGTLANRPAAGIRGRYYFATNDTTVSASGSLYRDTGTIWVLVGNPPGGGSVGPAGPQGPEGPQGPPGTAGAQGSAGPTGSQGPQGPTGPAGVVWPESPGTPRIVRGTFNGANGTAIAGAGWSAVRNGAGDYTVTFASSFGGTPSVIPGCRDSAYRFPNLAAAPTSGSCQIHVWRTDTNVLADAGEVSFIAIGWA